MINRSAAGSRVIAVDYRSLISAANRLGNKLDVRAIGALKIAAGEHLAAIILTTILGRVPDQVDTAGGVDLAFDPTSSMTAPHAPLAELIASRGAVFEVKSLPGEFRKLDAAVGRSQSSGHLLRRDTHGAIFRSIRDVLITPGQEIIDRAIMQLNQKPLDEKSKNVFLIAHFLDHPIVEIMEAPLIAHHLDPPSSNTSQLTSLWLLWAPSIVAVWLTATQQWFNIVFGGLTPQTAGPQSEEPLEILQHAEMEFLKFTSEQPISPWTFALRTTE